MKPGHPLQPGVAFGPRPCLARRLAARLLLATGLLLLVGAGCRRGPEQRPVTPEEAILQRQRIGLETLVAAARAGPLVPFDEVLVIVDEGLVQQLLASATPYERVVAGRYRVRLDEASVRFDDGFALVRLDGRASLAGRDERDVFVDVSVYGGLGVVDLDPASGVLRGRVGIIAFEARRVEVLGMDAPVKRLLEDLGRERVEEFNVLASDLEIPVRLEQEVTIPGVGPEGEVRIPAATVPLRVAVQDVKAFQGKLWVSVGVEIVTGGEPADRAADTLRSGAGAARAAGRGPS